MFSKTEAGRNPAAAASIDPAVERPDPVLHCLARRRPVAARRRRRRRGAQAEARAVGALLRPHHPSATSASSGDIQVEGNVEGDIRAAMLIVGESATVKGEVIAEEVVVHGRVVGRLRGLKVRLSASARCEGDIVHKTIAIESGAHFEGSVQRQDDPLGKAKGEPARLAAPAMSRRRIGPGRPRPPGGAFGHGAAARRVPIGRPMSGSGRFR